MRVNRTAALRSRPRATALLGGLVTAGLFASALIQPAAAATAPLPVPYTFLTPQDPYASPPGSNDFTCRPSAAHPRPVVLLHGLGANMSFNWQTFSPLLKNEGYCVFALTYGVPTGSLPPTDLIGGRTKLQDSAKQVGVFIDRVRRATGSSRVDLLGHSEGTVVAGYYTKFLGPTKVRRVVSLTPLWNGTNVPVVTTLSILGTMFGFDPVYDSTIGSSCVSCRQFLHGSAFMTKLRSGGVAAPRVAYTNIVTRYDELVIPYTSGIYPGMTNITVQAKCPIDFSEHLGLAFDPVAAVHVLNALDPAHPRPLRCVLVTPLGAFG